MVIFEIFNNYNILKIRWLYNGKKYLYYFVFDYNDIILIIIVEYLYKYWLRKYKILLFVNRGYGRKNRIIEK